VCAGRAGGAPAARRRSASGALGARFGQQRGFAQEAGVEGDLERVLEASSALRGTWP
jgi:hypothetical protein